MSIKLPHKLAPWESQLRIFPEETALALGSLVQKLAALLGPFSHHHVEGRAVPDGFAGLDKRGTYDRLISSDWLLADELPEEFMRRSVMGEHLFWKIAYRESVQARSTLVLFDSGPEQLGSPRLLHLAALAVFEARARMAKANFNWGVLQSREPDLLPGMNVAEVEALLAARGSVSADTEHFDLWLRRASDVGHKGEIWVVGSERLRQFLPKTFSSLLVSDLISLGESKLRVECQPSGKHSRHIELELPEPSTCARLLRDPFSLAVASRQKLDINSALENMVFNPYGNKLWVRFKQNKLFAFPVSNSSRDGSGKPKQYLTLNKFQQIAIGQAGRATVLVSMNPVSRVLSVTRFRKRLPKGLEEGEYEFLNLRTIPLFEHGTLTLCVWHNVPDQKPGLYLRDDVGSLWRLFTDQDGKRWCEVVHPHTLVLTRMRTGLCYVAYDRSEGGQVQLYINGHVASIRWPSLEAPSRAFWSNNPTGGIRPFGFRASADILPFGLLALEYGTHWEIYRVGNTKIEVPKGCSVHGVICDPSYEETLIIVEGEGNSQTLSLHGAHGTRRLVKLNSPISVVCSCQQPPLIAYGTEAGEISVYSLKHGKAVLDIAQSAI